MADWNETRIFARVAQRMSLTKAALDLSLPKSTVSRSLTRLETRLGLQLIERTTRRLRLTEAGQDFAEVALQMERLAGEAESHASLLRGKPAGLLTVSVPVTFLRTFLAPMLPGFLARYPEIRLELIAPNPASTPDIQLRAGALPDDSPLAFRRLGSLPVGLFASPAYLKLHGTPQTPADLPQHQFIAMQRQTRWLLSRGKSEFEVPVRARIAVADPVVHVSLAAAALGITIAPLWLAEPEVAKRRLAKILNGFEVTPVQLLALYPQGTQNLPKVRVFLEALAHHLSQMTPTS
jgi:DNA-binding transcriptional LysR family regulator